MATILNDSELKKLIGVVIIDGDPSSIRPNSYVLRLGNEGEFINAGKSFTLGKSKKGIRVSPGHSVALTALETINFSTSTVQKVYPGCALHAFISPTTDLSREGIVAPTTQVDAGFNGTLNWTITNTSNEERRFLHGERLFRLTILKLEKDEVPTKLYEGDYQGRTGYVRSQRKGAPVGMRDSEWEHSVTEEGPEAVLEHLLKAGYPWHALGQRLKIIDDQLKLVSEEYATIHDSLKNLEMEVKDLGNQNSDVLRSMPQEVDKMIKKEAHALQNRWLLAGGSMIVAMLGLIVAITSSQVAFGFAKANGSWIGISLLFIGVLTAYLALRKEKP